MDAAELTSLRARLSDIYRDYRDTVMSRKYYECRRQSTYRFNFWYEVLIACGTSGTVGGWALWSVPAGHLVWVGVGATVAIATIVKPILKLADELERLAALSTKYAALQVDFEQLIFDIKTAGTITKPIRRIYGNICDKMKDLDGKGDAPPRERLLKRCQDDVNREIPPTSLWSP